MAKRRLKKNELGGYVVPINSIGQLQRDKCFGAGTTVPYYDAPDPYQCVGRSLKFIDDYGNQRTKPCKAAAWALLERYTVGPDSEIYDASPYCDEHLNEALNTWETNWIVESRDNGTTKLVHKDGDFEVLLAVRQYGERGRQ